MIRQNVGQATMVMVFILGMASLVIALSLATIGGTGALVSSNLFGSKKAYYAATAGIEDLISRMQQNPSLGSLPFTTSINFLDSDTSYVATISSTGASEKIATATGRFKDYFKRIEAKFGSSSASVAFSHAVQTGFGGLELGSGAEVKCLAPCTDGNVYSNGDIKGESKNSSKINGSAFSSGNITRLGSGGNSGVWITKNASASGLLHCQVDGERSALSAPDSNCNGGTFTQISQAPPIIPLPFFDEVYWKTQAENGGVFNGDCVILSGTSSDCTNGTGLLGPIKINGNLIAINNLTVNVSGPVWVTGNVTFDNNVIIQLDSSFANIGTVLISDGKLLNSNNVTYTQTGTGRLLSVTTYTGDVSCATEDIAVPVSNNVNGLIAYAMNGCIRIDNNASYKGAIAGQKIVLRNNAIVEYDPNLSSAIYGVSSTGGWQVISWKEID